VRLLFVSPYVPSPIRVRPYHFLRELTQRHEVTVVATGSARGDAEAVEELQNWGAEVELVPLRLGAAVRSCGFAALRGDPLQSAVCHSAELRQRLALVTGRQHFDLIHVEHLRAARIHEHLPRNVPRVFDSVDCISLLLERTLRSSHSPRQRLVAAVELARTRRFESRALRSFDATVVTSSDDAQALVSLAPNVAIDILPNGVDLEHFQPLTGDPEPATLVFSGKMSYHANASAVLHFAREILPLVRAARPDVQLRVVGSNPPPAITALGSDPAITVTGHVADMREALTGATLAICPVTVKVGIQNKVLEAMALGLPVVVSRLGAQGLEAQAGRDFLVADDAAEFAQHVCRVLDDANLRLRLGAAGRAYVENNHRWDVATRHLEGVYTRVRTRNRFSTPQSSRGRSESIAHP
jgi:sugar transferase (PEP-CTERM/EpsH1 system associated)